MNIQSQYHKKDAWVDETGRTWPIDMLKKSDKEIEKSVQQVITRAMVLHEQLVKAKAYMKEKIDVAIDAFKKDYKGTKTSFKGNYTFFYFDRTVKVVVNKSQPITFDDNLIALALDKLKEFLNDGISGKQLALKEMVLSAFETSRGKLDVQKILQLKRYASRINDERYLEAMKLIDDAIRRPQSATYYRVFYKNEAGTYQLINLDFAKI